jgi:hypothetical protein
VNADGVVINVDNISVNVSARVIMLATDPGTHDAPPTKEEKHAHIDDRHGMHWLITS